MRLNLSRRRTALAAVVLGVALTACGGGIEGSTIAPDDVEAEAQRALAEQLPIESIDCVDELRAEVGASIECVLVSDGLSYPMTATVSSIEGDTANFEFEVSEDSLQ